MSIQLQESTISCPYCGEAITILIDESAGAQQYIEDCQVCCRPIEIHVDENQAVSVRSEDE